MKHISIIFFTLFFVFCKTAKGQVNIINDSTPSLIDSCFESQMCIGQSLAFYRKIYTTNQNSILAVELFDHRNILIAKGNIIKVKKEKYLPHGQWTFYTMIGKLRKSGTFHKGVKIDFWIDYDSNGNEFYRTYYRKEDKITNEQISILDAGVNAEMFFDVKHIAQITKG